MIGVIWWIWVWPMLKRFSIVKTKFQTITFSYSLSHIKLKFSIYSYVLLVDQRTPMGFTPLGTSTGTQTMLEYKDSNYLFITIFHNWVHTLLIASSQSVGYKPPTTMRHWCTRNYRNGMPLTLLIHSILCNVGLYYNIFSNLYHFLSYSLSYSLHKKSNICVKKYIMMILIIKVIT